MEVLTSGERTQPGRLPLIIVALVLIGVGSISNWRAFNKWEAAEERRKATLAILPRPEVIHALDFGFDSVVADWYWLMGLNYFGDSRNQENGFSEFYNYLKLVVSLDPKFFPAYLYGAYGLPYHRGDKWVNTEEAAQLLEKGISEFPQDWRLHFQLAYIYEAYLHRYREAGDQLAVAALLPGSPEYLPSLATKMYATMGDLSGAEALAEHLSEQTRDPAAQQMMKRRVLELRASSGAAVLTAQAQRLKAESGRLPATLDDLARSGITIPPEPLGGVWIYDPRSGEVRSSVLSERLTLAIHPGAQSD